VRGGWHAQHPVVVPIRDGAVGDSDEVRLLRARQGLATADVSLVAPRRVPPAFGESGAHGHNGVATRVEGATDLHWAPALAQFEQDLGACAH
jgi:hypothetical protein